MRNYGVTVKKSTSAPLMLFALYSPKGTYDAIFLANYAYININDQMTRVPGIASVTVFGAGQYAMRFWVKPDQLAKLSITVPEIINAIQKQNTVNPAGQVGGEPVPQGPGVHLRRPRPGPAGDRGGVRRDRAPRQPGRLARPVKDVARIELGAQTYDMQGRLNGKPARRHRPLPAARLQRHRGRRRREEAHGAGSRSASRRTWTTSIALDTTLAVHGRHEGNRARRCSRPSSWSSSWSSSSCRAGGPR